jgi:hypothetical protein
LFLYIHESIEQLEHTIEILAAEKFVNLTPKVQNIVEFTNIGKLDLNRTASMTTRVGID